MAMNQFEFLGNDKYLKYRFTQETPLNYTTVEETWGMDNHVLRYSVMADYLKRSFNIKAFFEKHTVSYMDLYKIYTEPENFNNSHCILIPLPLSIFDGRQHFTPSPVFETARTIILSGAPKRVMSTSMSFINMDTPVVILIGFTLVLLSLLLVVHSIVTNKFKSVSTRMIAKKLTKETLQNVWDNASLLCAEPMATILPHITCRLLAASWLIGVTFILFFLGCYLRTEFAAESYIYIDTFLDLIKSGIPPTMIKEAGTLDFLKYFGTQDLVVKEWLDALDQETIFSSLFELLEKDGYTPILSGKKALIISETYLTWFLGEFLRFDPEHKEFLANNGGLYFSQHEVAFESLHFIFNTSWIRSSPIVHESVQLIMRPHFETQALDYLDFEINNVMERVTWKKPMKSVSDLDLSSVFVPFYLLFFLMSGAAIVVITEIIFNAVR